MPAQMSWNEWIGAIYNASDGKLDYSGLDPEIAQIDHPVLYASYQSGIAAEAYVAKHLVTYESGQVAQIDPDDAGDIPDDEYGGSAVTQSHKPAEARLLASLSADQINLLVAWLDEEASLHQRHAQSEVVETLRYMGQRLEAGVNQANPT
ncbi:hypothetical protein IFO70_28715 [Phormidium tenue FACHB-886]|nr:hypothetical protein [Phormidium tenue FACHB-886]